MKQTVYVLIPAHNNRKEVLELLECLQHQTYQNIKAVLVDDGSTDGTEVAVRESFPDTVVLKGNGELWWTGANVTGVNYILKEAGENDFILLLNNDLIVHGDYISMLVEASEQNERAIAGSALVDYEKPDFIESGVRLSPRLELIVNRDRNLILHTDVDHNVDVLPGRGTLVPVEVFRVIGNFNGNKLPHYGADYEFSIRAKRAGFNLIVSNRARVYGKLSITGLNISDNKIISLKKCFTLMFSKKSKTNLIYYLNYVWMCSDKRYRALNTIRSFFNILSVTLFRTIPFYVPKIISSFVYKIYVFLIKDYPLRRHDLERQGLNTGKLINDNILTAQQFRGGSTYFYKINNDNNDSIEKLPSDEKEKILYLKRCSFSYPHKFAIILEKLRILLNKEAVE